MESENQFLFTKIESYPSQSPVWRTGPLGCPSTMAVVVTWPFATPPLLAPTPLGSFVVVRGGVGASSPMFLRMIWTSRSISACVE